MKRIENPEGYTVCEFDGVSGTGVYLGGLDELTRINDWLTWREDSERQDMVCKELTLAEISKQCWAYGLITVIVNEPLSGKILQYGNYGDKWYQIGETCGYA